MEREDTTAKLVTTLTRIISLDSHIQDRFFVRMLREKTNQLVSGYTKWASEQKNGVAQYDYKKDLCHTIESLVDILQIYFRLHLAPETPLLDAMRSCLELKLAITEIKSDKISETKVSKEKIGKNQEDTSENSPKNKSSKQSVDFNRIKNQIISFLENNPEAKTKDIISALKPISKRTIQRYLANLVKSGLAEKNKKDKEILYKLAG